MISPEILSNNGTLLMNWLQKAADGGLDLGGQALQGVQSPQTAQPQGQPQGQPQQQAQPQKFNLQAFLEQDAEAMAIVQWLIDLQKIVKPYWENQQLLQRKLADAGVKNLQQEAPEIYKLFKALNEGTMET
jgi:hypothetical protein